MKIQTLELEQQLVCKIHPSYLRSVAGGFTFKVRFCIVISTSSRETFSNNRISRGRIRAPFQVRVRVGATPGSRGGPICLFCLFTLLSFIVSCVRGSQWKLFGWQPVVIRRPLSLFPRDLNLKSRASNLIVPEARGRLKVFCN